MLRKQVIMQSTEIKKLILTAMDARERAYAPYSHFLVGAALQTSGGQVFGGCNVENAAYGAGICAERNAALQAVAAGELKFTAIAVVGWKEGSEPSERGLSYPCGICRQFLNEFAAADMPVIVARSEDDYFESTLGDLLPHSFGPQNLVD